MGDKTKYIVELSISEREMLDRVVKIGKVAASKRQRAQILLYADEGAEGPSLVDVQIAKRMGISTKTVFRTAFHHP